MAFSLELQKVFSRSLEQFFLILGQNNLGNKIPILYFFTEPRDPRPPKPKKHSLRKFSDLEIINQSEGQASTFNNQIEKDYLEVESNQWSGSLPSFDEKSMPSR